jgi:hypothetical protein
MHPGYDLKPRRAPRSRNGLGQDSDFTAQAGVVAYPRQGQVAALGPPAPVSQVTADAGRKQATSTRRILLIWADFPGFTRS